MTYEFAPTTLTGALVYEVRTRHKLSRAALSQLAGFTGKSTARLSNIELKESWKPGDREALARALNELTRGRFDPRYHASLVAVDASVESRTDDRRVIVLDDDDDDLDATTERLATVVAPPTLDPVAPPASVATPITLELGPSVDDGAYRVSNGELQCWKRCRRKWWFAWYSELRLRAEELASVRSTGDRVHRALSRWYVPEGQPRVDPRDALERVIVEDWTHVSRAAVERGYSEERFAELARAFGDANNLERAMIEGYVQWLEETGVDAELRVIASETPLTAELEVDVAGHARPLRVIGLLDARVHRVTDGRRLFIDHKTVGDLQSPAVTLPQNEQMLHYDLLEWLNTPEGEERCDGALYNMLRRVKRSTRAKPPFYDRVEVHHNVHELASYRRRLLAASRDVLAATDALLAGASHLDVAYPSPRSDCRWDCDFFAVCGLLDDGSTGVNDMINTFYRRADPRDRYARGDERGQA